MPFIAIALFLAIALGGGATVIAENAQPGDAMYSVKTHVNDNVRSSIKATEESFLSIGSNIQTSLGIKSEDDAEVTDNATTTQSGSSNIEAENHTDLNAEVKVDGEVNVQI